MVPSKLPSPPGTNEATPTTFATTNTGNTASRLIGWCMNAPIAMNNPAQPNHSRHDPTINWISSLAVKSLK